jgi:enoyl-CoA hydratase/carnithine racemase
VSELADYQNKYLPRFQMERTEDGILIVRWKQWTVEEMQEINTVLLAFPPALQVAEAVWRDIAEDAANKVVILTGTGSTFYAAAAGGKGGKYTADIWTNVLRGVTRSVDAFLDIPAILIGAANGPATVHAEYLMMCDLVLASENTVFEDRVHFVSDMVPGDGVNVIWPMLLGWKRGVDFLLTGRSISANEALDLGLVREVVSSEELLSRSVELGREMLKASDITRRLTASSIRKVVRRAMAEDLHHSMALEGLIFIDRNRDH